MAEQRSNAQSEMGVECAVGGRHQCPIALHTLMPNDRVAAYVSPVFHVLSLSLWMARSAFDAAGILGSN